MASNDVTTDNTVVLRDVTREYGAGEHRFRALDGIGLQANKGEFVIILGPSGAGKSTLLNLLGGLDSATSGQIMVDGRDITALTGRQLTRYRAEHVGFVFQSFNLIPTLTALENVALVRGVTDDAHDAGEMLTAVGLADHADQFPAQLSGGEQQRVSIARAVAKRPSLLLCDEPTGALDSETGTTILELLHRLSREHETTVVIVTHNALLAPAADRVIRIRNGRLQEMQVNETPVPIHEVSW